MEERFSEPVHIGPGVHPASYIMGTESFVGVNRRGRGVDYPPPSKAEVKEKIRTKTLLPHWSLVACSRVNFTFTLSVSVSVAASVNTVMGL